MSGVQAPRPGRRAKRGPEAGQATPSLVAVASVVAIVVAMVAFFAGGDDGTATQAEDASSTRSIAPSTPLEGPPTAARTPSAEQPDIASQAQPAKHKNGQDEPRKRDKPAKKPRQEKRAQPTPDIPQVYVEVYNNTSISGLAASTGAELQDSGWQVVGVDNWYGDIPSSTVYYPDGLSAEAHQLAEELGIERVRGAVPPMRFDRLTVILTEDAY